MRKWVIAVPLIAAAAGAALWYGRPDAEADWPGFGRTGADQHNSPLDDINAGNVKRLGLAWSYDLQPGNSVSAPVEADGVVYTATGLSVVTALDAETGRELWRYDPEVFKVAGKKLRYAWGIRGLAYDDGLIFVGTQDGRLIALDGRSGKPAWSAQTTEPGDGRYITGAPRIFGGKVLIGHGGADYAPVRGYVTCYDAKTGKQLWRFYTVPGDPAKPFENPAMERAAKTWSGRAWVAGGGGTAWHGISYDVDTDTVMIGVGNGFPWDRRIRSEDKGDNLYLASIVGLDAKTGNYRWHYQVNPGETWDYTATQDMVLADLKIGGEARKVVMQAPKNGFFYVVDRTNGRLISADPIVRVSWAKGVDPKTGRPIEVPGARYPNGQPFTLWPGSGGAHSWLPMAFSPKTGLVYIPVHERPTAFNSGDFGNSPDLPGANVTRLIAWDPVKRRKVWSIDTPGPLGGGVISTDGNLVFQGDVTGRFNAYDATNGQRLWSFAAGAPVIAPPISYRVKGKQYVTVQTGYGVIAAAFGSANAPFDVEYRTMKRRVLTFALDANTQLPKEAAVPAAVPPSDPAFKADPAREAKGRVQFTINCSLCHGAQAVGGGAAPDLRRSTLPASRAAFDSVVREGALLPQGMPRFDDLPAETVEDIRFYILSRAQASTAAPVKPSRP